MVQATTGTRKQRIESAIAHALARRWNEAAEANQALLKEQPEDLEAANRLGKALTELGDVKGAIAAYQRALEIDPGNPIARKNLAKLETTPARKAKKAPSAAEAIRPQQLIDESGKSAVLGLHKPNARALKRISVGDTVQLEPGEQGVNVKSSTRAVLGHLDPRAGQRLKRLIEGGNRYEATIRAMSDDGVTVAVRETHRDPKLLDEASFVPPSAAERKRSTPRAYTRESMVQRDAPIPIASDDDSADEPDVWSGSSGGNEMEEAGFGEEDADEELDAAGDIEEIDDDDEDADPPDGAEDFDDDDSEDSDEDDEDSDEDEDDDDED